jgi:hypothetical protein
MLDVQTKTVGERCKESVCRTVRFAEVRRDFHAFLLCNHVQ